MFQIEGKWREKWVTQLAKDFSSYVKLPWRNIITKKTTKKLFRRCLYEKMSKFISPSLKFEISFQLNFSKKFDHFITDKLFAVCKKDNRASFLHDFGKCVINSFL